MKTKEHKETRAGNCWLLSPTQQRDSGQHWLKKGIQFQWRDRCTSDIKLGRGYAADNERLESHNVIHLHLDSLSNSIITRQIYGTKEIEQKASAFVINFITQHLPWNVKLVTFGLKAAELDHLGAKAKSFLLIPVLFFPAHAHPEVQIGFLTSKISDKSW